MLQIVVFSSVLFAITILFVVLFAKKERELRIKMSEAKAAQEKESDALARLQQIYDVNPIPSSLWDVENLSPLDCNMAMVKLLELSGKDDFLHKFAEYNPAIQPGGLNSADTIAEVVKRTIEDGFHRYQWMFITANGEEVLGDCTSVRIDLKDKHILSVHFRDLREEIAAKGKERDLYESKQRIAIAEESNRAKTQFLTRMSHEMRTPISAVMGIAEIQLYKTNMPLHIEEAFSQIFNSSTLLLHLIDDILDLSRIETNELPVLQAEYETESLISSVVQIQLANFADKGISFKLETDDNLPLYLIGDIRRIGQVVNNLLSNAFKYTEKGSVELSVSCEPQAGASAGDVTLEITVRDTGIGMSAQQVTAISNEYLRFHEAMNRNIAGVGLGMSIVYNLLSLMNGQINIESEIDVGTTVVVSIPQKITRMETLGKPAAKRLRQFETSAKGAVKRTKIEPEPMPYGNVLIVDDIEANIYVAKGLLAFFDLNVDACNSGYEAIEKIKQGKVYDIVFMDYMMPGLNGTETMQRMREIGYTQPVVALTANAIIGQAEEYMKSGYDGFIAKPIQVKHLNTVLRKFIRDKQPPEVIKATLLSRDGKKAKSAIRGDINDYQNNPKLVEELRFDFARRYKNIFNEILEAVNSSDTKMARLLTHTLKGSAGLIHESSLAQTAEHFEQKLLHDEMPTDAELSALESKLGNVLNNIGEPEANVPCDGETIDKDTITALFENLETSLLTQNLACLELLDEIRRIPGADTLCEQIKDFDFQLALKSLAALRSDLEKQ